MELTIKNEQMNHVNVGTCIYEDYAGGRCDALLVSLSDAEGIVRRMKLKKGDAISAAQGVRKSGEMYISTVRYEGDSIIIRAVSTDADSRRTKNDAKTDISFYEMLKDVEAETGYELICKDIPDVHYKGITRINKNPMQFMERRLQLEGYGAKIYNRKLIVFNEAEREKEPTEDRITEAGFNGKPNFKTSDSDLIASVKNTYLYGEQMISTYIQSGLIGKAITENMAVTSIEESERFSKGIMRLANKNEYLASGWVTGLERSAGRTIELDTDIYGHAGINFIYAVEHDLINERQCLCMRKPLKEMS